MSRGTGCALLLGQNKFAPGQVVRKVGELHGHDFSFTDYKALLSSLRWRLSLVCSKAILSPRMGLREGSTL